jgi:sugar lactone lactonase YvrE
MPTVQGSFALSVTVVDAIGEQLTQSFPLSISWRARAAESSPVTSSITEGTVLRDTPSVAISLDVEPTVLPVAYVGLPFTASFTAADGGASTTFSGSGDVPSGLSFKSTGGSFTLSGTPTAANTSIVTVSASDAAGHTGSRSYFVQVNPLPPLAISPAEQTLANGTVGTALASIRFVGSGGSSAGNLSLSATGMPSGTSFVPSGAGGTFSGTPIHPGSYTLAVTVTDSASGYTETQKYPLTVRMPELSFSPSSFPTGIATKPYSSYVAITNPSAGYSLSFSGTLPLGLTADASGTRVTVSGTPTQAGDFPVTVTDTDQYGNSEPRQIAILITPAPAITITSSISPATPIYTDFVTLTTTITGNYASPGPTGFIFINIDGVSGANALGSDSPVTFKLGRLAPGTHTVTYTYGTDVFYPAITQTYTFSVAYPPYALLGAARTLNSGISQGDAEAMDSKGNLYITESNYNYLGGGGYNPGTVAEIDSQGNLSSFAVSGLVNPNGIAIDANDNVYISDTNNKRIVEVTQAGVQTVLAVTGLQHPVNLAFDPQYQNLYIADWNYGPGAVFQYNIATQVTTQIASLYNTYAVAVSPSGTLYIGEKSGAGNGGLFTYDPIQQTTTQLALPALDAASVLTFDRAGNLYIGDGNLYRLDSTNTVLTAMSDYGGVSLAVDSRGNIDELGGQSVVQYVPGPAAYAGSATALKGSYYTYPGTGFKLYYSSPAGVTLSSATAPSNGAFLSNSTYCVTTSLCAVNMQERPQLPGLETGSVNATFSDNTQLQTSLYGTGYQAEVGLSPGSTSQVTTSLNTYGGATTDQNGVVYVTDSRANEVYRISNGAAMDLGFTGLSSPTQLAVDGTGAVYVLDSGTSRIMELDSTGKQSVVFDLGTQSELNSLTSFALDGATNLWLGGANSAGTGSIMEFSAYSLYSQFATGVQTPTAMAFDSNANLYAVDAATGTLNEYDRNGQGTALATGLSATSSMAIEPSGTVYLAGGSSSVLTRLLPAVLLSVIRSPV